jgi:hypothetical protein
VRETFTVNHDKKYIYRADGNCTLKWKSPIFMPYDAARIFLRITNVRFERVQEITPEEVKKEGLPESDICRFAEYWDKLNSKRGYSWESNPWVYVVEFVRISKSGASSSVTSS